jgi:hypothetical protein
MIDTKIVTADEVLDKLSDKARIVQIGTMVALKAKDKWHIGRITTSAGVRGEIGLVGTMGEGFLGLEYAEKVLVMD